MSDPLHPHTKLQLSADANDQTSVLRQLGAGARVIQLDASNGNGPHPAVGRQCCPPAAAPPSLGAASVLRPDRVGALIDARLAHQGPVPPCEVGDATLVRLLMQGKDLAAAALDVIRRRFPDQDVVFLAPDYAPADAGFFHEVAIDEGRRQLGRLRSRTIPAAQLLPQAAWLAAWLALRDQHAQLYDAAVTDPLTGAHNRRFFDHFLEVAIAHARERHQSTTVLVFDIDDFKLFNQQYGHVAGDEILRQTVRLLRSVVRPSDRVCRIGGDEFAVVFHEPTGPRTTVSKPPSSIFQIARRFQQAISDQKFPKLGCDAPGVLTVSGGLATYPRDGDDAASLLARADAFALFSKRIGKNCMSMGPVVESDGIELALPPPALET